MSKVRVFVAMSGGVDSSVAAMLLQKRGFDIVGVHMKCYNIDGCGERDAEDARRVAEQLGIPFYVFDLEKEYKERVVQYMVDGYKNGLTPNTDVMCNKEIKFGLFLRRALELGADYVATGHYVRLRSSHGDSFPSFVSAGSSGQQHLKAWRAVPTNSSKKSPREIFSLFAAKDGNKDQSYFLWTLTQEQLQYCLFPIGDYTKPQVRRLAKKFGLLTAEKKDSQGICFLGKVTLRDFLKDYISEKRGVVLNVAGQKIGEHKGAYFYTIGQRGGLGVGGLGQPHYVVAKDIRTNTVTLAEEKHQELFKKEVILQEVNFINSLEIRNSMSTGRQGKLEISVLARIRYRQPLTRAILYVPNSRELANRGEGKIIFDKPQKFIAKGQSAVFYTKKKEMIGGGVIY